MMYRFALFILLTAMLQAASVSAQDALVPNEFLCQLLSEGNDEGITTAIEQELMVWDYFDYPGNELVYLDRFMDWLEQHPCITEMDRQRAKFLNQSNPPSSVIRFQLNEGEGSFPGAFHIILGSERLEFERYE